MATVKSRMFGCAVCILWASLGLLEVVSAQTASTAGFISIDCGATSNFTDTDLTLTYSTDEGYISWGTNRAITLPADLANNVFSTARYFTEGRTKNCYELPVSQNSSYLIRAEFLFGDLENAVPNNYNFDLSVDSTVVHNVAIATTDAYEPLTTEFVVASTTTQISFCIIPRVGYPFISGLALRPLVPTMYRGIVFSSKYMRVIYSLNCGAAANDPTVRYPDDRFDRLWMSPSSSFSIPGITTTRTIFVTPNRPEDNPPAKVLQSAWEFPSFSFWSPFPLGETSRFYSALYFYDIGARNATDVRIVDISFNGGHWYNGYEIVQSAGEVYSIVGSTVSQDLINFTFVQNDSSTLPPLLNGAELHAIYDTDPTTTLDTDVVALNDVRENLGLQGWTGDPCLPVAWDWLVCSNVNPPRVTQLNLSYYGLRGTIPSTISQLTQLTDLWLDNNFISGSIPNLVAATRLRTVHLQNNSLTGPVPASLGDLPLLTELFLQNNNLSGPVPQSLNRTGLTLLADNSVINGGSETGSGSKKKSSGSAAIVGAVVGAVVVVLVILLCILVCCWRMKKRKDAILPTQTEISINPAGPPVFETTSDVSIGHGGVAGSHHLKSTRTFSREEVQVATNNFKRKIGEGGFGPVYYGVLPAGGRVAVKVNSESSNQGSTEFSTEVSLLSRVHHKNLVSLLGYCEEGNQQILIYEYMENGTLQEHLYGRGVTNVLDWNTRLDIALNAARGLEYLHNDCSPKIIHRDVKSNNILLNEKWVAKVADFGISKLTPDEDLANGVSTKVRGTMGYLDPEYFQTNKLTQKSDVFAFGVVLLEIIAGRAPMDDTVRNVEERNLVEYARGVLSGVNIDALVDKSLHGTYNGEAMWKLAELAMYCVEPWGIDRPDMRQVVREVTEAIDLEDMKAPAGAVTSTFGDNSRSWNASTQSSIPDAHHRPHDPSAPASSTERAGVDHWSRPQPR